MPHRLEITLKPGLFDAEGQGIRNKTRNYFGIDLDAVRTIQVITIDAALTPDQLTRVQTEIFTNPVTQVSAFTPLALDFDWTIWVGFRPGVKDNAGSTAVEAVEDVLGIRLKPGEAIYTSKRYCIQARASDGYPGGCHCRRASGKRHYPAVADLLEIKLGSGCRHRHDDPQSPAQPQPGCRRHSRGQR